ncbi:hypothetical protein RFI_29769 [Reticulomyxa filosa]|uniref:Uncharacterized protein n=1 Tax=Reticulomyxa filosa TaxID=46433 RepID=X6M0B1_RETFI|nr:hypothetical protein RFI_29769 [Reticulomyxa filosa]|eukprot:ETO07623.1 hypothetical protein RFI_29769 [Reticulomyxa filosa]
MTVLPIRFPNNSSNLIKGDCYNSNIEYIWVLGDETEYSESFITISRIKQKLCIRCNENFPKTKNGSLLKIDARNEMKLVRLIKSRKYSTAIDVKISLQEED